MKYTPEQAVNFTKKSVALLVCWPPPVNTSKRKLFLLDAYFFMSYILALFSVGVLVNGMYTYRNDLEIIIQSMCIGLALIEICIKSMACRVKRSSLQVQFLYYLTRQISRIPGNFRNYESLRDCRAHVIIEEMENVLKQAQPFERIILNKYVNRCAFLHMFLTFGYYLSASAIIMGPIFLPQPFPTFAIYPFNVDSHPIYEIVYFQQAFTALQGSAAATIDCLVASLLWFAGARLEMLKVELSNVLDVFDLKKCILKHQHLIRYAENVVESVRLMILATVAISAMIMIFGGILFLFTDATMIKFQFSVMILVCILQLFVSSYPAENLLEMSYGIGSVAYGLNWIDKSRKMWADIRIIIQRSQKPVIVSVGGLLPSLSLTYYMSFLSSSFSYFTTLRATVQ